MSSHVALVLLGPNSGTHVANMPIAAHAVAALSRSGVGETLVAGARDALAAVRSALTEVPTRGEVRFMEHHPEVDAAAVLHQCEPLVAGRATLVQAGDAVVRDPLDPLFDAGGAAHVLVRERTVRARNILVGMSESRLLSLVAPPGEAAEMELAGGYVFPEGLAGLPAGARGDLSAVVEGIVDAGGPVDALRVSESWRYGGDKARLIEGNRLLLEETVRSVPAEAVSGCDIQGKVNIHPSARLKATTIRGPAVIGAGAHLNGAYVGPYTSIGPNVTVEGAEIEHSIVLHDAIIAHVGRRLETSVIGAGARVSRDFRLPSALRLTVGDGAEVSFA